MKKTKKRIDRIREKLALWIRPKKAEKEAVVRLGLVLPESETKTIRTMLEMKPEIFEYFMQSERRKQDLRSQLAHGLLQGVAHELHISTIYDLDREMFIIIGDLEITKEKKEDKKC